jgi:hypothetical protein
VAATVVIVACWAMVNRPDIITAEEQAFRIVNNAPDALWPVLWAVMQLGNLAAPIVVAGLAAARGGRHRPSRTSWRAAGLVCSSTMSCCVRAPRAWDSYRAIPPSRRRW